VDRAIANLSSYDWLLFTSPAGVRHFWVALSTKRIDARGLAGVRVAALGKATEDALSMRGITADIAARTFDPAAVAERLRQTGGVEGLRILFPREAHPASPIAGRLTSDGAVVDEIGIFRLSPDPLVGRAEELLDVDVVVLPSSSAARAIAAAMTDIGATNFTPRFVAIGPATAQTALACGLPIHAVAGVHSVSGVVDAVDQILSTSGLIPTLPPGFPDSSAGEVACAVHGADR
jgi:uroporphyrinogen III methyltransferase/synthase